MGAAPGSWRRWALIAAVVFVPVAAIIAGLAITSGTVHPSATRVTSQFTPITAATPARGPAQFGYIVARVTRSVELRSAPAGRPLGKLGPRTEFGSPSVVLVADQAAGWLGVVSPLVGNGRIGWIPESATALARVRISLEVSLTDHRLTVLDGSSVLRRYTVAVGAPGSPTPAGRFAVTDRLLTHAPSGPYGCCILALSAESPHAIQGWTGGNRIAIHSTPDSGSIGQSVTHGCVRVTLPEGQWLIDHVPLGTPAVIRS